MYEWIRPKIAIPAHGEALHLTLHRDFAKAHGRAGRDPCLQRRSRQPRTGAPVGHRRGADRAAREGWAASSSMLMDEAIPERRKLSFSGTAVVAIALDERGNRIGAPDRGDSLACRRMTKASRWRIICAISSRKSGVLSRKTRAVTPIPCVRRWNVACGTASPNLWDKKPYTKVLIVEM